MRRTRRGPSNTWVAIQAYYACYHAMQALIVARGQARPTSHPKTQRMYADTWATRASALMPWSLGAVDGGYVNLPAGHLVDETIHAWVSLDASVAVDIACKALRTTRDDAVTKAKKDARIRKQAAAKKAWRTAEDERLAKGRQPRKVPTFPVPRLSPAEHAAIDGGVRANCLFDYLYRLRMKAQYEDSTLFSEGPDSVAESEFVFRCMSQIVRSTLMLHEIYIERIVGRQTFERVVDDWIRRQANVPVNPLATRRALILP